MKKVIALSLLSLALSGCFKNPTHEIIELSKDHWISHFSGDKTQEYKECIQTKKFNPKNQKSPTDTQEVCRSISKPVYEEIKNNFMNGVIMKESGIVKQIQPVDQLHPVKPQVVNTDLK